MWRKDGDLDPGPLFSLPKRKSKTSSSRFELKLKIIASNVSKLCSEYIGDISTHKYEQIMCINTSVKLQ